MDVADPRKWQEETSSFCVDATNSGMVQEGVGASERVMATGSCGMKTRRVGSRQNEVP